MKYCLNCGAENGEDTAVCKSCNASRFALDYQQYLNYKFFGESALKTQLVIEKPAEPQPQSLQKAREEILNAFSAAAKKQAPAEEFFIEGKVLKSYKGAGESIAVPNGVEEIEEGAFNSLKNLKRVTLPDGLKKIGSLAFADCQNLKAVNFPSTLKEIGSYAFADCTSLEEIDLPEGVITITQKCFKGCRSLRRVKFPSTLTRIEKEAFASCSALEKIDFPKGLEKIEQMAFVFCSRLKTVEFPASVREIGPSAFGHCMALRTAEITVPDTQIGWRAFDEEVQIKGAASYEVTKKDFRIVSGRLINYFGNDQTVVIPKGVKEIGPSAFANKRIKSVVIPEGVTKIGYKAFSGCFKLEKVTLPYTVKEIGENAFAFCMELKQFFIPKSVEIVCSNAFFSSGPDVLVCGAPSKPKGWDYNWNVKQGEGFIRRRFEVKWGGADFIHDDCLVHKD